MKMSPFILTVVVLVAGTVPLVAQQATRTPAASQLQVEARITKIDKDAGLIVIETSKMPGHDTPTELRYVPSHPAALTMYQVGDRVWARLASGKDTARVELLSYAEPATAGLATGGSPKEFKVEGTITNIDQNTGDVTIETTHIPGHDGKMTLSYRMTHLGGLVLYMTGEKVLADIVVTAEGPRVQSIGSTD